MSETAMNLFREISTFERGLKEGDRVEIRWTAGSFGHYTGTGKVTKKSRASVRVALDVPVASKSRASDPGTAYPVGREISVPLFLGTMASSNSKWTQFNRVAPLTTFGGIVVIQDWCLCKDDGIAGLSESVFADDNLCPCGCKKHHYHCRVCGKIAQVG